MLVTDIKRTINKGRKNEKEITGFYMTGYLKTNLDGIKRYLAKEWDVVGVVSGHGLVGVGKSTIASQVAYYTAWILAGGEMVTDDEGKVVQTIAPTSKIRFNLQENVVFSAEDLQERSKTLYDKYGKNQVIVYDEGRQGLDSKRSMESVNKGMEDFFQECRVFGHVIIIVLPNFFKLHEDYAVARSIFLIDAFSNKNLERGYFNFYNHRRKENLFYFGKKKIGVTAKYSSATENFWGKFTKWMPYDKLEYENAKREALEKKRTGRSDRKIRIQRDALVWDMYKNQNIPLQDIRDKIEALTGVKLKKETLEGMITKINQLQMKGMGYN